MGKDDLSLIYYLLYGGLYLLGIILVLWLLFGLGLLLWISIFGEPCWLFNGGAINDTVTREMIAKCSPKN